MGDLDEPSALDPPESGVLHGDLYLLALVHGQYLEEHDVSDAQVPGCVPELDLPGNLVHMEGCRIRGTDVHEPIRRSDVHDDSDDRVPGGGHVATPQGDDAYSVLEHVPDSHDTGAYLAV